jgi:hypothetical protein
MQSQKHDGGGDDERDLHRANGNSGKIEGRERECIAAKRNALLTEQNSKSILHQHQQSDRGDHRHIRAIRQQRLVQQPVDCHSEQRSDENGGDKPEREASACIGHQHGDIGAERKDRGVRDMEDAQQAVHEGQADRHHGVHAAETDAGDSQIDVVHQIVLCGGGGRHNRLPLASSAISREARTRSGRLSRRPA